MGWRALLNLSCLVLRILVFPANRTVSGLPLSVQSQFWNDAGGITDTYVPPAIFPDTA